MSIFPDHDPQTHPYQPIDPERATLADLLDLIADIRETLTRIESMLALSTGARIGHLAQHARPRWWTRRPRPEVRPEVIP